MSVIVAIPAQLKSCEAIEAACKRLGMAPPIKDFQRVGPRDVNGISVRLPGRYGFRLMISTDTGEVFMDEDWLSLSREVGLDAFKQQYQIELARIEATKRGARFQEFRLPDGSVKLRITPR